MVEVKPELGYLRKYDKAGRNEHYVSDICVPTPDETAACLGRVQIMNNLLNSLKPKRVLELGCHDGFMTRALINEEWCDLVTGVEINQVALKAARDIRDTNYAGKNLTYVDQDMFEFLEKNENKWDLIVISEVIEHFQMQEIINLVQMAYDRLEDGGALYITTPDIEGPYGRSNPDPEHITLFSAAMLDKVLDDTLMIPSDVFKFGNSIFGWVEK
jgi:2-polyprenyl-3-methyl-5-hydroxy-6-metoxy-1,4-benzoquinol methylase